MSVSSALDASSVFAIVQSASVAASAGVAAVAPMPTRRPLEATAAARAARRRSAVDSGGGGNVGHG